MFLKEGCFVSLHYNNNCKNLNALLDEYPKHCCLVQANVANEDDIINAFKKSVDTFGTIHILVANHGIFPPNSTNLIDMSLQQFNNTININLTGVFLLTREWMKQLRTAKENNETLDNVNCILIGSTSGIFGEKGHIDYSSSKSALSYGFCKTLKNELPNLIPNGRVNVVAPGWVLTPMAQNVIDNDSSVIPKALQTVPLNKIATTEDVANSIVFLASKASGHITGCILEVSGGMEGRCLNPIK